MTALGAWVGFPLAFAALVVGWGFLVEVAAGRVLAGALLPGAGFAALIVALALPGFSDALAPAALWLGLAGAAAGWALRAAGVGPREGWPRPSGWAAAAAGATFVAYLAPTLFSGHPAVGGYIRLDDSATFVVFGDYVLRHGYDLAGLAPSSHNVTLSSNLPGHYPVAAFLPLAAVGRLVGTDLAWCFSSYLACAAAVLALTLYELAGWVLDSRAYRALAGGVAAASGLLYGYVGWGGIKEIVAAALVALLAALAPAAVSVNEGEGIGRTLRGAAPAAAAAAALLGALSVGGAPWVAIVLLPALVIAAVRVGPRVAGAIALAVAVLVAAGSVVALGDAQFLRALTTASSDPADRMGNLIEPLNPLQVLGIWPAGDFRLHPPASGATTVLLLVLGACIAAGIWAAARRGAWPVLAYGIGTVVATAIACAKGTPWLDAKALAIAAPAPLLLGMVGIGSLERELGRAIPVMLTLLVVGGVVWTDVRMYHDTTLTPFARHRELADIGRRYEAWRPALMTEYDPWGARWFLRRMEGEGASELRYRVVPLLDGSQTPKTTTADVDRYQLGGLLEYRALVLRRSPVASRPPSAFRLERTGRFYEVWLRRDGASEIVSHLPLGDEQAAGGVAACADVARLRRSAEAAGGRLLAAPARTASLAGLDAASRPAAWVPAQTTAGAVLPYGAGVATTTVRVARAGRYDVWLGGAVKARTTVSVDGRRTAALRSQLQYGGQWLPAGALRLRAGTHAVAVRSARGDLAPGSGGEPFPIGPVALSPARPRAALISLAPAQAQSLCGRTLDWIEAVAP